MSGKTTAGAIGERGTTLAKTSLKLQAYKQIKERIILGEVPGGAALSEQTLVDDLGISRTPIREALNMLQHEQLVEIYPKQGVFVTRVSYKDVMDIYSLRVVLEPYAAKAATTRIDRAAIEQQLEIWRAFDEHMSPVDHVRIDRELHTLIAEATENKYLINYLHQLYDQANRIRHVSLKRSVERMSQIHEEHLRILEAMLSGDGDAAAEGMRLHLVNARDTAVKIFGE